STNSAYLPLPCPLSGGSVSLNVTAVPTGYSTQVDVAPVVGQTAFSILAVTTLGPPGIQAASFNDASALMPSTGFTIDMCQIRVINAAPATAEVFGVTTECHDCAHPLWPSGNNIVHPTSATGYTTVFCGA